MVENIAPGVALALTVVVVLAIEGSASVIDYVRSRPHDLTRKRD